MTARELAPAVAVLQLFLSSSKPVLRFAAVRTLNKVAMIYPIIASTCNIDMETLIADQVRACTVKYNLLVCCCVHVGQRLCVSLAPTMKRKFRYAAEQNARLPCFLLLIVAKRLNNSLCCANISLPFVHVLIKLVAH